MSILHWLLILVEMAALALVPVILMSRKEPVSTFAWILTLIFLPVLGALLFLIFGRTSVRSAPRPQQADHPDLAPPATNDPHALVTDCFRIAAHLTHATPTQGNRVDVLIDGDATYAAIGAAFDAATRSIYAEYYLIHDDEVGRWFRDRLAAAAMRGVAVRLMYDGYGSLGITRHWTHSLRKAGGRCASFSPLTRMFWKSPNLRNHRKIIVVDGRIGFTGGINISAMHSRQHAGALAWRDIHLRLEGPAVRALETIVLDDWSNLTGERLPIAEDTPTVGSHTGAAKVSVVPSGPDSRMEAIHRVFFAAITGARSRILITSPYFGPDESVLLALELAAMRGVAVQLVLPARSNHRVTFQAGRSLYERLLESGVSIAEYQPGMVHTKVLVIDGIIALVGSSNMDLRSFRLNFEVHALIQDLPTVAALETTFAEDLAQSVPITLERWHGRSIRTRLLEGAARLLSPLL